MGYDQGQRTVTHLVAQLGMSESEVLDAAFSSEVVRRVSSVDDRGRAARILFEYDDVDELNRDRTKRHQF